jgi:hypothetical protein
MSSLKPLKEKALSKDGAFLFFELAAPHFVAWCLLQALTYL